MSYVALQGGVIVAHITQLPATFTYLVSFKDGKKNHISSLEELRSAGYTVRTHSQRAGEILPRSDRCNLKKDSGDQTAEAGEG